VVDLCRCPGDRRGTRRTITDYKDLVETPEAVASTPATMSADGAHPAALLTERPYPPA